MNFLGLMFAPGGRIARLPYFLCLFGMFLVIAFLLVAFVIAVVGGFETAGQAGQGRQGALGALVGAVMMGMVFFVPLMMASWYVSINLAIKRLHDIGWSGWNILWLYGLSFFGTLMHATGSTLGEIFSFVINLACFAFSMWLTFAPGDPYENEFGPAPA